MKLMLSHGAIAVTNSAALSRYSSQAAPHTAAAFDYFARVKNIAKSRIGPISLAQAIWVSMGLHIFAFGAMYSVSDQAFHLRMSGDKPAQPYVISATIVPSVPAAEPTPAASNAAINSLTTLPMPVETSITSAKEIVPTVPAAQVGSADKAQTTQANMAPVTIPVLPPAPDYRPRSALETAPKLLTEIVPVYPENDGLQEGAVVLRILIDEKGNVDDVAVVRSFPAILFDTAAINAFQAAKFSPGKYLGIAVKSQLLLEVKFTPYNRGGLVNGRIR